jgi:hypothetical protein
LPKPKTTVSAEEIRPIHAALRESLKGIDIKFQTAPLAFRKDKFQTGQSRELSVKEFLESFFPSGWSVKKGPIFDREGTTSDEVDCALCIPEHPPCLTSNRQLILAERVYAAIEVKPDLTSLGKKSEFRRALDQCDSVKKLKRVIPLAPSPVRTSCPLRLIKFLMLSLPKKSQNSTRR